MRKEDIVGLCVGTLVATAINVAFAIGIWANLKRNEK